MQRLIQPIVLEEEDLDDEYGDGSGRERKEGDESPLFPHEGGLEDGSVDGDDDEMNNY